MQGKFRENNISLRNIKNNKQTGKKVDIIHSIKMFIYCVHVFLQAFDWYISSKIYKWIAKLQTCKDSSDHMTRHVLPKDMIYYLVWHNSSLYINNLKKNTNYDVKTFHRNFSTWNAYLKWKFWENHISTLFLETTLRYGFLQLPRFYANICTQINTKTETQYYLL